MLFVPYPAFGHVNPMVPVVRAVAARGVSVRVVADPRHAHLFHAANVRVVPLAVEPRVHVPARLSSRLVHSVGAWRRKWAVGRDAASIVLAELARERPSLVVVDPAMAAAERAVRRAGVPTAGFSTTYLQGGAVPAWWRRDGSPGRGSVVVNRLRRKRCGEQLVVVNAVPELQPCLPAFGELVRFLGPLERGDGGVELAQFGLPTTRPVLLVSPGTVFAREPRFFVTVARAFAATPWLVVMSTGVVGPESLAPLPDNVIAAPNVPQPALLRHADVFLTHAGMNSALEAMARGVPMVVSPRAGDQRFVARRLVELGLARALPSSPLTAEVVRDVVEGVAADPVVRATARRRQAELIGRDTAATAADLLLASAEIRASAPTTTGR